MVLILVDMGREDQDQYKDTKYNIIWPFYEGCNNSPG